MCYRHARLPWNVHDIWPWHGGDNAWLTWNIHVNTVDALTRGSPRLWLSTLSLGSPHPYSWISSLWFIHAHSWMAHPQSNHAHVHAWMTTPMAYQRSRVDRAVRGLSTSEPAYDFQPQDPEELDWKLGDIITVLDKKDPNWWTGDAIIHSIFVNDYPKCVKLLSTIIG